MDTIVTGRRMIKVVGGAMMAATLVYGIVIFIANAHPAANQQLMDPEAAKNLIIIFSAIGVIEIFCANFVKDAVWNSGKRSIKSMQDIYTIYFQALMAELAMLESVAIFGVVLFITTRNTKVSIAFVLVSFLAQIVIFAMGYDADIEMKKSEFPMLKQ